MTDVVQTGLELQYAAEVPSCPERAQDKDALNGNAKQERFDKINVLYEQGMNEAKGLACGVQRDMNADNL